MPVPPPSNETQSAWPSSEAIWSGVHGTPRTGARAVASAPAQRRRPTMRPTCLGALLEEEKEEEEEDSAAEEEEKG